MDQPESFDRLCTITIQGGGIYGFSLLGQLRAVEEKQLFPVAIAGTSAGGLIAALAWAGYSSADLVETFELWSEEDQLVSLVGPFPPDVQDVADPHAVRQAVDDLPSIMQSLASTLKPKKVGLTKIALNWIGAGRLFFDLFERYRKVEPGLRTRGLFRVDRFTERLDELFLVQLNRERKHLGLPLLEPGHRPTFGCFYKVFRDANASRFLPALFLTATNLCTYDVEIFDSVSSCYSEVAVSDAVRASIAFPVAFKPQELSVWRDQNTGQPANRQSYYDQTAYRQSDLYVDGGLISNFPFWALTKRLRKALYGHDENGEDTILADGERFGETPDSIDPNRDWELQGSLASPLKLYAHRPMVHIGLQLLTDAEMARNEALPVQDPLPPKGFFNERQTTELGSSGTYYQSLVDILTRGARSRLEGQLNQNAQAPNAPRIFTPAQTYKSSNWDGTALSVHLLTAPTIRRMYNEGYTACAHVLNGMSFDLPDINKSYAVDFDVDKTSIAEILGRASNHTDALFRGAMKLKQKTPVKVRSAVFLAQNERLWLAACDDENHFKQPTDFSYALDDSYVGFSFAVRTPLVFNHFVAQIYNRVSDTDLFEYHPQSFVSGEQPTVSLVVPILDRSDVGQSDLGSVINLHEEVHRLGIHPFGKRFHGAFFGVLVIDVAVEPDIGMNFPEPFYKSGQRGPDKVHLSALQNAAIIEADRLGDIYSQEFASKPASV